MRMLIMILLVVATPAIMRAAPATRPVSQVDLGDAARLDRAIAKAKAGEPITIAALGGSITQGFFATVPANRYADRVAAWWQNTFPKSKVTLINAGIGATGSEYGCLRVARDVLSKNPDFVIVEFSVNDANTKQVAEMYEGVVRQILAAPSQPACVLLFMTQEDHTSAQEWDEKIGRHYSLPMFSYRDGIFELLDAKKFTWKDISPDNIHPNDRGHELAAKFVTDLLAAELAVAPKDEPSIVPLPAPLLSDRYAHTELHEADALMPTSNAGWVFDPKEKCWRSDRPGSTIAFEMPGDTLSLAFYRLHKDFGKVRVTVDGANAQIFDGWFKETWGGKRETAQLATDLPSKMHVITIELLDEKSPASNGHEFRILGLGAAGVK